MKFCVHYSNGTEGIVYYGWCEGICIKSILIVRSKNTKTSCRDNEGKNCVTALY